MIAPSRWLPLLADRRSFVPALAAATLASLLLAAAAVPRLDFAAAAQAALDRQPDAAQMTPYQREEALATARKIGAVTSWAGAALGPALRALGAAVFLWLGLKVAGGTPRFSPTFSVAAYGLLPQALRALLTIPALLAGGPVRPEGLDRLLPSSLAAFLPADAPPAVAGLLASVDLFSAWALALVAVGMAHVAGVSRRRAAVATAVLWLGWVAVFRMAIPSLAGPRP